VNSLFAEGSYGSRRRGGGDKTAVMNLAVSDMIDEDTVQVNGTNHNSTLRPLTVPLAQRASSLHDSASSTISTARVSDPRAYGIGNLRYLGNSLKPRYPKQIVARTGIPIPLSINRFASWYRSAGHLKIFWVKPAREIRGIEAPSGTRLLEVEWSSYRGCGKCLIAISRDFSTAVSALRYALERASTAARAVAIVPEDDNSIDRRLVDAEGILYFWDTSRLELLEPCRSVDVSAVDEWSGDLDAELSALQAASWGFYKPPIRGVHRVFLASLEGRPVGAAYLNLLNYNIDYGVHVARAYWRRRIGTRILWEIAKTAREMGSEYFSVVRVYRKIGGTSSDRRAAAFYRANKPVHRASVLRIEESALRSPEGEI